MLRRIIFLLGLTKANGGGDVTFANNVTFGNAAHGGLIAGAGKSATPYTMTGDSKSALSFYATTPSTADSNRTAYFKLTMTGAAGGGEAVRAYGIGNAAGMTDVRGIHASAGLGTSGTVTGEIQGARATLEVPNSAVAMGTASGLTAEVYMSGTSSAPTGNVSLFRGIVQGGDATAQNYLSSVFRLEGLGTNVLGDHSSTSISKKFKVTVNGSDYWIPLYAAV